MSHNEFLDQDPSNAATPSNVAGGKTAPTGPKTLRLATQTNQIIYGALIQGIVMIVAVFWFIGGNADKNDSDLVFLLIGCLIFIGTTFASFVAPKLIPANFTLDRSDELAEAIATVDTNEELPPSVSSLMATYATQSIVVGALLEGGAVVNSVLWFLDGNPFHLLFVVLSIALMAMRFPTLARLREFLVAQTRVTF